MFAPAISPANPHLMMLNCDMSGAYISTNGGHDWRIIHQAQSRSDTACRPAFHPTDPKTVYASSAGRLKVSHDGGLTFVAIGDLPESLGGEIAINQADPNLMLVGTRGGHSFLSRDAGKSWVRCEGPSGEVFGFHFDQTRQGRTMFAATQTGIWRSDNEGRTWTEKTAGLPWKEIQGFGGGSGKNVVRLYCTIRSKNGRGEFQGGVYRSSDRGEHWESAMGAGLNMETQQADQWAYGPVPRYRQVLVTDAQPLTAYVFNTSTGFNPPHSDTVYRTDDGGQNWRATYFEDPRFKQYNVTPDWETASCGQSFKGGETPFGVAICNTDPERVMLVRNEPDITHDGGKSWFTGHTYPAPGQKPGPGSAWVCNGLVVTTTWHFYTDPFETNRQYICYTDIGLARSLNAGQSWIWWDPKFWAPWRNTCYGLAFDPEIPGKIWGAFSDVHDIPNDNIISERHSHKGPGGVCRSRDFGASWKSETQGLPRKPVTSVVLDPKSPKNSRTLYASVFDEGVFKSTDDGKTWVLKKSGLGDPENMRAYRVILHRDGTLFCVSSGKRAGDGRSMMTNGVGIHRSIDAGETWGKIMGSTSLRYVKDFSVDPRHSNRILLGAADPGSGDESGGLYLTGDGGQNWRRIGREGPQTFGGYFHPEHEDWIYMTLTEGAPGAGLWLSQDNGKSWRAFQDLPFSNIQRVEFDGSKADNIHVTTFGAGVWLGPAIHD
jgi:photosystem II stability/assembly factor-like uncharacterized protein